MNTDRELMQQALDALEWHIKNRPYVPLRTQKAFTALRERLAQPEFPMHEEGEDGWSDFVCPDPKSYLMKCCDCGLVHEAQFKVVRYKSEAEREDCEPVDDPNLQAVFRMRRSEQWSPKDTAYRPGGLAQPEQEPVAWMWRCKPYCNWPEWSVSLKRPADSGCDGHKRTEGYEDVPLYTSPPQSKPLTDEVIWLEYQRFWPFHPAEEPTLAKDIVKFARAIEAAHGITGEQHG
jgi:hypothetical protein